MELANVFLFLTSAGLGTHQMDTALPATMDTFSTLTASVLKTLILLPQLPTLCASNGTTPMSASLALKELTSTLKEYVYLSVAIAILGTLSAGSA